MAPTAVLNKEIALKILFYFHHTVRTCPVLVFRELTKFYFLVLLWVTFEFFPAAAKHHFQRKFGR